MPRGVQFHAIDVEIFSHALDLLRRRLLRTDAKVVGAGVYAGVDHARAVTHVFHDVAPVRMRPSAVCLVGGQRPARRPGTQPGRQLRTNLQPAVEEVALVLRHQPFRGIRAAFMVFAPGDERQHAVGDARVLRAIGVMVALVVATAVAARVAAPFRRIGRAIDVEPVLPDQRRAEAPFAFGGRGGGRGSAGHATGEQRRPHRGCQHRVQYLLHPSTCAPRMTNTMPSRISATAAADRSQAHG